MAKRESAFFKAIGEAQKQAAEVPRLNLPVKQQDSMPVSQDTSIPVSQQDSMPVKQYTGKPVRQHASKPVRQQISAGLVKATFYLSEDDIMQLEHIRLARRSRGLKMDKSALIREAIKLLRP